MFGLDGVLVDINKIHFSALNEALEHFGYKPQSEKPRHYFDKLSLDDKLEVLNVDKEDIPKVKIWTNSVVMQKMKMMGENEELVKLFDQLQQEGYKIAICSNALDRTAHPMVHNLGLGEYVDMIRTVEDVENPKPHPEMWWQVMTEYGMMPEECIIIENSKRGLDSAYRSGVPWKQIQSIESPEDITRLIGLWINPEAKAYRDEVIYN